MRKLQILLITCCLVLHAIAQNKLSIVTDQKSVGINLTTNKEIVGYELIFPERIDKSYFETESNRITIQLRNLFLGDKFLKNNGHMLLYDLTNKKTIWEKSINYQNYSLEQNGKFIFRTGLKKTYCLDFENGDEKWKAKNSLAFIKPDLKIGIGYTPYISSQLFYNNKNFEGIDLNTGKTIWEREINQIYGLDDIFMLNDSIAMIVSSGLHTVNIKTGRGWDYNAVTGTAYLQAMQTGICSNVIIDNSDIYFASKEKISKLDINGNLIWSTVLPKELTSSSNILLSGNTLYMINSGSAQYGYATFKQGKPFLAAFNKENGDELFLNTVDNKSGKAIESLIKNDDLVILYKDKIARCSLQDGTLISEKKFDTDEYGEFVEFINRSIYNKFDSTYKSLVLTDTINRYVYTKKKTVLAIDRNLNVVDQFDMDQLYRFYLECNSLRFFASKDCSIIIDKNNKTVAKINIPGKARKVGSKLYFINDNSIIEINLDDITHVATKSNT